MTRTPRQHLRASAYLETCAITLLFGVVLAGALLLSRAYTAKLKSMQRAREAAIAAAGLGCDPYSTQLAAATNQVIAAPSGQAERELERSVRAAIASGLPPEAAQIGRATSLGARLLRGAFTAQTTTSFACNERIPAEHGSAARLQSWLRALDAKEPR